MNEAQAPTLLTPEESSDLRVLTDAVENANRNYYRAMTAKEDADMRLHRWITSHTAPAVRTRS